MTKKNIIIWICVIVGLAIAITATTLGIVIWGDSVTLSASATQIAESSQASITWDTNKAIEKVQIDIYHHDYLEKTYTFSDAVTLHSNSATIDTHFGKNTIEVTVFRGICKETKTINLNVFASEYNIAPLMATMPVTMFTLDIDNITKQGTIPTFVWFDRGEHWNYAYLPENVYAFPGINEQELDRSDRDYIYDETSKFVKELYDINPSSKFNFYYNDGWSNGYVRAVFANNIPETNCKLYLLSDGSYSYDAFNSYFNNPETSDANYADLLSRYELLKTQVAQTGKYEQNNPAYALTYGQLGAASYVLASEYDNIEWWLPRKSGVFASNNPAMKARVENDPKAVVKDLKTLFTALTEEERANTKLLFNFSSSTFKEAEEANKKAMIILGTNFENEYNFELYVKALQKIHGDEYVYYYKGHPRYPAILFDGRIEELKALNLYEIESSIPAELLFFFNPDAYCAGYQSSTFTSLNDQQSVCVFNTTLEAFTQGYENNLDYVMNLTPSTNDSYGSLITSSYVCVSLLYL